MTAEPVVLALFLPLAGAAILRAGAGRLPARFAGPLAAGMVGLAHAASWWAFARISAAPPLARLKDFALFPLLALGDLKVDFLLRWDPLSQVMVLVVTGVSFLIHLYSVSYMEGDDRFPHFFADLNLFTFAMLLLVLAGNFLLLFFGWELVGLCSYLLIGFWGARPAAAGAGLKAFVVNRVGDAGFILALLMVAATFGTLDYGTVFSSAPWVMEAGSASATALALLLFCGAAGKSAQFPLHVWLPDAMEGPTPVSALIHAATMVTAGVYLVCRCAPLFDLAPVASSLVAWVGAFTALFAGLCALAQKDLKRVLAFSTVSQLGLMFLGAGVGAYAPAMFHLFTHAFFKALLFLAAGSVMHALAGETNLWKMGGLGRRLPWTYWTFLAGALALAGAPLTAGFFSKDRLLFAAFESRPFGSALWAAGLAASALTALYIFRAFWLAFRGEPRGPAAGAAHEGPPLMRWPLAVLAALAIGAGFLWLPDSWGGAGAFGRFLAPVWVADGKPPVPSHEDAAMALAVLVFLLGLGGAWRLYRDRASLLRRLGPRLRGAYRVLSNKFFVDEFYLRRLVKPLFRGADSLERKVDRAAIDASADRAAGASLEASSRMRGWQTGFLGHYALAFAAGVAALLLVPVLAGWWILP